MTRRWLIIPVLFSLAIVPAGEDAAQEDVSEVERLLLGDRGSYMQLVARGAAVADELARILADRDSEDTTRMMAANALGDIGSAKAVEPLLAALEDPWFNIRRSAALALGKIRDERARAPLEKLAREDPFAWKDPETGAERYLVREDALQALDLLAGKVAADLAGLVKEKEVFLDDASKLPPSPAKVEIRRLSFPFAGEFQEQNVFNNYQQPTDAYVHAALDILHPPGTEVRAVEAGRAALVATNYPEWKTHHFFIVTPKGKADEGWCYTHVDPDTLTFEIGDEVRQGQVLGKLVDFYVGKNKGADHLHLHYVRFLRRPDGNVDVTSLVDPLLFFDWEDERAPEVHAPIRFVKAGTTEEFTTGKDGLPIVSGNVEVIAGISDAYADQGCNWMVPVVTIEIVGAGVAPWRKLVLDQRGEIAEPRAAPALYVGRDDAQHWKKDLPPFPTPHFLFATHTDGDGVLERADALQSWSTAEMVSDGKPRFPNGDYQVTIRAWDLKEQCAERTQKVRVENL